MNELLQALDRWWDYLDEQTERIRVEINCLSDLVIAKLLKILAISSILFIGVALLSLLQPVYVVDKIVTLWVLISMLEVGILGGLVMSESVRENTFKAYAERNKKEIEKSALSTRS